MKARDFLVQLRRLRDSRALHEKEKAKRILLLVAETDLNQLIQQLKE